MVLIMWNIIFDFSTFYSQCHISKTFEEMERISQYKQMGKISSQGE